MLVIYHNDCFDGLAAAWAVNKAFGGRGEKITFLPAEYKNPEVLPEYEDGETIIIVDFSYSGDALTNHFSRAKKVVVIDHHERPINTLNAYFGTHPVPDNVRLILDTKHSGASLTWKTFFHNAQVPVLIKHVEDHDLWLFKDKATKAYIERLSIEEFTLEAYDAFSKLGYLSIIRDGELLLKKKQSQIDWHINNNMVMVKFEGFTIPMVNVAHYLTSFVGDRLCEKHPFALMYFDIGPMRRYSLRTANKKLDMSSLAKLYGGNGHPGAAGFRAPTDAKIVEYIY